MSIRVIVSMDVNDYDNWKAVFNSEGPINARTEAGLTVEAHRNLDNPNNAIVIVTAPSKEAFLEFFPSPQQKERMQFSDVMSQPTVTFLENYNS